MNLIALLKRAWRSHKRWREADNKGWAMLGRLLSMRHIATPTPKDQWRADWCVRNGNRLYRLTRGHGNPWKPCRSLGGRTI